MILIADSGSTKTDWCVVENGQPLWRLQTKGINPVFQTEEEIAQEIATALLPHLPATAWQAVHFYGAGCAFPEPIAAVSRALARHLGVAVPEIGSDMLAAARGLCGHDPGIACILGTGSNSCYYDGRRIVANVSPLGFILGDEGSGACLGKLLVGDLLKNQLPVPLKTAFFEQFRLTPADIIDRVYRRPFPNRFLASLSPFLAQHLDEPTIRNLVSGSFRAFLRRNVLQYEACHRYPLHFTGSIAYHYREVLGEAVRAMGMTLGIIRQSPMEGLLRYHSRNATAKQAPI